MGHPQGGRRHSRWYPTIGCWLGLAPSVSRARRVRAPVDTVYLQQPLDLLNEQSRGLAGFRPLGGGAERPGGIL